MFSIISLLVLLAGISSAKIAYRGVDISSLPKVEKEGRSFKSLSGSPAPFESTLAGFGVNSARQRLWVNPSSGSYDLSYNIKLAKRVRAAGMNVYLDLHYSDDWADPAKQWPPQAWKRYQTVDELATVVQNYTKSVCDAFANERVDVEIISLGNEIRSGLLWPLGKTPNFTNIAKLLHEASRGVKESKLNKKPKIMLHLDNGYDWGAQKWFYDGLLKAGTFKAGDFDAIGVSFYPQYSDKCTFGNLKSSLQNLKSTYNKEVMVVETDWPGVGCSNVRFPDEMKQIPQSPAGQSQFLKKLGETVDQAGGTGVYYWEPAFLGNAGLGSKCADLLMVEPDGKARKSLEVFKSL